MPTECDEVLLNPYYSAKAVGGPSFATALTQTDAGITNRKIRRYDYISKYTIDYLELENEWRKGLREFHILQWGQAYAFRFLAPDDQWLEDELITDGFYNPATITAGVDPLVLHLIKTYARAARRYQRRIVKPAWDTVSARIGAEVFQFETTASGAEGAPLYGEATYGANPNGEGVTLDYTTGDITLNAAARTRFDGQELRVSCQFHIPAAFGTDDNGMATDETAITDWSALQIVEVLPIELGILV